MGRRKTSVAKAKQAERTERRRSQTASEILGVGRDVLLREGIASFTLAAVADELGLTTPALYYYFDSKEALLAELLIREWMECAGQVQAAVEHTDDGAAAVEQLMRTVFDRYRNRLDLFSLAYKSTNTEELTGLVGPEELERIRPVNDMLYGGAETRLRADQRQGAFPKKRHPRRFAFTAHMAVLGILSMKAMTESASDPLVHSDGDLIDDVCTTFRAAMKHGDPR